MIRILKKGEKYKVLIMRMEEGTSLQILEMLEE